MQLTVLERIVLLDILPKEGTYVTLKIIRQLQENLSFSEEEIKTYEMTQDSGRIQWRQEITQVSEIPIGEKATDIVVSSLKALDKASKLTDREFSLYEKFIDS